MHLNEILTARLKLTLVETTDAEKIHVLRTDPYVARFIIRDLNTTVSDIRQFISERLLDRNNILFYKIETIPDFDLAGTIVIKNIDRRLQYAEIGYELFGQFEGQGLMSAALEKIIALAAENIGIKTFEAFTHRDNSKSRKMLERLQFTQTDKTDDKNPNNVIYRLIYNGQTD